MHGKVFNGACGNRPRERRLQEEKNERMETMPQNELKNKLKGLGEKKPVPSGEWASHGPSKQTRLLSMEKLRDKSAVFQSVAECRARIRGCNK